MGILFTAQQSAANVTTTLAIALLLGLLFAARDEALVEDLYPLLLYSFELILGAMIGLLTGEATSRQIDVCLAAATVE